MDQIRIFLAIAFIGIVVYLLVQAVLSVSHFLWVRGFTKPVWRPRAASVRSVCRSAAHALASTLRVAWTGRWRITLALLLAAFAYYVWPTPWTYPFAPKRADIRVNRFTNRAQVFYVDTGWKNYEP